MFNQNYKGTKIDILRFVEGTYTEILEEIKCIGLGKEDVESEKVDLSETVDIVLFKISE